jgi:hypothetical protein
MRQQHLEPRSKLTTDLDRNAHTKSTRPNPENNTLIFYGSRAGRSGFCPCFPGSRRTSGPAATCSPPRTTATRWIPDSPPGG